MSEKAEHSLDNQLLANLLRRSAGIHCPCSPATLRASLLESLKHLSVDNDSLLDRVEAAIEGLIVGGDLLELDDVVTQDMDIQGNWVFAAPPSFVIRPSGSIFLFGVVPDQDKFLPNSLAAQINYDGYIRTIKPRPDQNIAQELREQGLQQISDSAWLKSPRTGEPETMLNQLKQLLARQSFAGSISELKILDPSLSVIYYRGRWKTPTKENGTFVARRPQEFGAPIWCFVHLKNGAPVRLLDLPLKNSRWRGCDMAWHLQMAIDYCRGAPQQYRRSVNDDDVRFDFYSPLPQWAQRRLMIIGHSVPAQRSLISYVLPSSEAETEEQYLQQALWLAPVQSSS